MTSNHSNLTPDQNRLQSVRLSSSVRLGAISFINTIPVYFDFQTDLPLALVYDVPARLNAMMAAEKLHVSPVSSAFYLRNRDNLVLLDDVSVSSPGAVESVIFISAKPWGPELLDFDRICVPDDSETSVALLAHLLKRATGQDLRARFGLYAASDSRVTLEESGNALIIGDNALMAQANGVPEGFYCYDLSSLWREQTGLPFVFAVWVANAEWATRNPQALKALNNALCQSRERFYAEPSVFQAGVTLARRRSGLSEATLRRYYRSSLTYGLEAEHHAALRLFRKVLNESELLTPVVAS